MNSVSYLFLSHHPRNPAPITPLERFSARVARRIKRKLNRAENKRFPIKIFNYSFHEKYHACGIHPSRGNCIPTSSCNPSNYLQKSLRRSLPSSESPLFIFASHCTCYTLKDLNKFYWKFPEAFHFPHIASGYARAGLGVHAPEGLVKDEALCKPQIPSYKRWMGCQHCREYI